MTKAIKQNSNTFFKSLRSGLERFGRAMILPVSIIPLLAIVGAIGYIFASVGQKTGIYNSSLAYKTFADSVKIIGMAPIYNLDILFSIGLAAGLAKDEKVSAGICGVVALIGFYFAGYALLEIGKLKNLLDANVVGKLQTINRFGKYSTSFDLNALGGILAGYLAYGIHKITYKLQFPTFISFFGGPKFSPVATLLTAFILGFPLTYLWIYIYKGIAALGNGIRASGAFGSFLYGSTNRLLLPFGLHNIPNAILRYTAAGGIFIGADGQEVTGFYSILIAKMSAGLPINATDSMISNGTYPTNIFSLPGAAVAMFLACPKDKRKQAAPIIFGAVSSSILSGVTEPIEFTFIFSAPILWLVHCVLTGLVYMTMYLSGVGMIAGTGEGIITYLIYNLPSYENISRVWMLFVLGPVFFIVYFGVFYFLIKKFNFRTPGRDEEAFKLFTKKDFKEKLNNSTNQTVINEKIKDEKPEDIKMAQSLLEFYGGFENINEISCCISRLRISVKDKTKVNREAIMQIGAKGVVESGEQVQSVFGAKAMVYSRIMNNLK